MTQILAPLKSSLFGRNITIVDILHGFMYWKSDNQCTNLGWLERGPMCVIKESKGILILSIWVNDKEVQSQRIQPEDPELIDILIRSANTNV